MKSINNKKSELMIIFAAFLFGLVGVFVRESGGENYPLLLSFLRVFFSFVLILVFLTIRKSQLWGIGTKDKVFIILAGISGYTIMSSAFTISVQKTSLANTFFLLYTAPFFVLIIGRIFLKEKISSKIIISVIFSFLGVALMFNQIDLEKNIVGSLWGILCGFSYSIYLVLVKILSKNLNSEKITIWTTFTGCIGLLIITILFEGLSSSSINRSILLNMFYAGIVVAVSYFMLNYAFKKVAATTGSLLLLFEPISAIVFGIIIYKEYPSIINFIGILIILINSVYISINSSSNHN